MPCLQQPEAYIGGAGNLFDNDGKLTHDSTRDLLHKFVQASPPGSSATRSAEHQAVIVRGHTLPIPSDLVAGD